MCIHNSGKLHRILTMQKCTGKYSQMRLRFEWFKVVQAGTNFQAERYAVATALWSNVCVVVVVVIMQDPIRVSQLGGQEARGGGLAQHHIVT